MNDLDVGFERGIGEPLLALAQALPSMPLISVVITSYNSLQWLDAAIDSILDQTWSNLEILIVDDCSTDGSREHIVHRAGRDARIRPVWMNANSGTYVAKNAGIRLALGDVITFMDSDDLSLPQRLEAQLEALRPPGIVATTSNYERRTPEGITVLNRGLPARQALISLMIKRAVVNDIGWFDSVRVAADDEYFERLRHVYGRQAHRNVNMSYYIALLREGSLSNAQGSEYLIDLKESGALPPARADYKQRSNAWHKRLATQQQRPYMPLKLSDQRPF